MLTQIENNIIPDNGKKEDEIFALVDCNNFYASCERVFNPKIKTDPIVILSNNDGCAVSMSSEAKILGIDIGTPIFKAQQLIKKHKVKVFSSNYALYGDLSRRVMDTLALFTPEIEIYSIDESFLSLKGFNSKKKNNLSNLENYGYEIKKTVKQWTGIPVSVGIAKTKTLAKIANRIAKKKRSLNGVLDFTSLTEDEIDSYLDKTSVEQIWGIGRQNSNKLNQIGIYTALALKNAPDDWIKKNLGGVVGLRTVFELRGNSCIALDQEGLSKNKKGITTSRSFGKPVEKLQYLEEAIASYTSRAAEKLRAQKSVANVISIYIKTNKHKKNDKQYSNSITYKLPYPTSYSPELVSYAINLLRRIYKEGYSYKKVGVLLLDIIPDNNEIQMNLFTKQDKILENKKLMFDLDKINSKWGSNTLKLASNGTDMTNSNWRMKREFVSKRSTTCWNEIPVIKI